MIRNAKDLPEARSRLLRHYAQPDLWSGLALDTAEHPVPPHLRGTDPGELPGRLATWCSNVLCGAELYWISAEFSALARHAGAQMPVFAMHREVVPAIAGLMVWETPVATRPGNRTDRLDTIAVAWSQVAAGVWMWLFDDAAAILEAIRATDPDAAEDWAARVGWLAEWEGVLLPWAHALQIPAWEGHEAFRDAVYATVSSWLLIGQTLAHVQRAPDLRPRDARRLARRSHPTTAAQVVTLRRSRDAPTEPGTGGDGRVYSRRWIVGGHWRNQWYPSISAHRPIWINPHVKGPDGAPLITAEKVYALRR